MDFEQLFDLTPHGPDTFVGAGPRYPWGGLYGGQIVAQALRSAALTVETDLVPHSLRAYFIRSGDHSEPVRYEVDRIRNGRSFCTRRVVARQAVGAILNLEASFVRDDTGSDLPLTRIPPDLPPPDRLQEDSWSPLFRRRRVAFDHLPPHSSGSIANARVAAWLQSAASLGDDPIVHFASLAFLTDDLATEAARLAHSRNIGSEPPALFCASLDHTIWFHRPVHADQWHLQDVVCHTLVGTRGLTIGHVFAQSGTHVATFAQEVLVRESRGLRAE